MSIGPLFSVGPQIFRPIGVKVTVGQIALTWMLCFAHSTHSDFVRAFSLRSLLVRDGLPPDIKPKDLIKAGAVGDVLGAIIDKNGDPVDHSINERVVGIGLDDMRRIPNTILAAGGSYKIPVMNAVLRKGLARVLVTDEASAESLLAAGG